MASICIALLTGGPYLGSLPVNCGHLINSYLLKNYYIFVFDYE